MGYVRTWKWWGEGPQKVEGEAPNPHVALLEPLPAFLAEPHYSFVCHPAVSHRPVVTGAQKRAWFMHELSVVRHLKTMVVSDACVPSVCAFGCRQEYTC